MSDIAKPKHCSTTCSTRSIHPAVNRPSQAHPLAQTCHFRNAEAAVIVYSRQSDYCVGCGPSPGPVEWSIR